MASWVVMSIRLTDDTCFRESFLENRTLGNRPTFGTSLSSGVFLVFYIADVFTVRKRSLGQGDNFTSLCHSYCPQWGEGGWPPSMHHRSHDQGVYMGGCLHPGGLSLGGWLSPGRGLPPGGSTSRESASSNWGSASRGFGQTPWALWDAVYKRAVHILLECILVLHMHSCAFWEDRQEQVIIYGRYTDTDMEKSLMEQNNFVLKSILRRS